MQIKWDQDQLGTVRLKIGTFNAGGSGQVR